MLKSVCSNSYFDTITVSKKDKKIEIYRIAHFLNPSPPQLLYFIVVKTVFLTKRVFGSLSIDFKFLINYFFKWIYKIETFIAVLFFKENISLFAFCTKNKTKQIKQTFFYKSNMVWVLRRATFCASRRRHVSFVPHIFVCQPASFYAIATMSFQFVCCTYTVQN